MIRTLIAYALAAACATVAAASAPVAYWKLDETTGVTAADASGNARAATVVNGTWIAGGHDLGALQFNGATTYAELPTGYLASGVGTVSLWVRSTANLADLGLLFYGSATAFGNGTGPEHEIHLHLDSSEKPAAFVSGGGGLDARLTAASAVADGVWRHVALTWQAGGSARLYVNGLQAATATVGSTIVALNGRMRLGCSASGERFFNGAIDDVRLYDTALAAADITQLSGPGEISFSAAGYSVSEGTATVTITAVRTGGSAGAVGATYQTADATAFAGQDYTAKPPTVLSWAAGTNASKTFTVAIANDALAEMTETFAVTLTAPTGGAVLGNAQATVSILDNDGAGTIQWAAAPSVTEGTATVTLTANRVGGSLGAISVAYRTADGSALAGSDYTAKTGTLVWNAAETAAKTFTVAIINDAIAEPTESFSVILETPTGGAFINPTANTAVMSILDNDGAGSIQFSAPVYTVGEAGPTATITATRVGGSAGAVGVSYATSDGSAAAGSDYTTKTGTLVWAAGSTSNKTFTVAITNDTAIEADETLRVTLSSPTGGATLGLQSQAVVRITDNDGPLAWYRFDESSGGTAIDSTDHGNGGTVNAATWVTGKFSNGLSFNGTSTRVDLPNGKLGSGTGTVAGWIKTSQIPATRGTVFYGSSVTAGDGGGPENELTLHLESSGRLGAFIEGGANPDVALLSPSAVNDNAWHHVAFTWLAGGQAVLYVDGAAVASGAHSGVTFTFSGRTRFGQPSATVNLYAGLLDDVRLWTRPLSASEIVTLFDPSPPVTFTSPTLIAAGDLTYDGRTIVVDATTLTVNGAHAFAGLTLRNGAVLTHSPTTAVVENRLEVSVTGTLNIDATSAIDVTGNGFAPGYTNGLTTVGSSSGYSGGSHGGYGHNVGGIRAEVYGSLKEPSTSGSGGGNLGGGSAGGGIVHISAGSMVLAGAIRANGGGYGTSGGGSEAAGAGGSVCLHVITYAGNGVISANGGKGTSGFPAGDGGGGRVAVHYATGSIDVAKVTAFGNSRYATSAVSGHGTVFLQRSADAHAHLVLANLPDAAAASTELTPLYLGSRATTVDDGPELRVALVTRDKARCSWDPTPASLHVVGSASSITDLHLTTDQLAGSDVALTLGSILTSHATTVTAEHQLSISVTGTFSVDSTSTVTVTGRGYRPGRTVGNATAGASSGYAGGSHGGYGVSEGGNIRAEVYGDFRDPRLPGSGSGSAGGGSCGGGAVHLVAGSLVLNGSMLADGGGVGTVGGGSEGSGAGGSIAIEVTDCSGSGVISANGGSGNPSVTGRDAGGGRISVRYVTGNVDLARLSTVGGRRATGAPIGGHGTIYIHRSGQAYAILKMANQSTATVRSSEPTPIYYGIRTDMADDPAAISLAFITANKAYVDYEPTPAILSLVGSASSLADAWLVIDQISADALTLGGGTTIWSHPSTATRVSTLDVTVSGACIIDASAALDATGRGYLGGRTLGNVTAGASAGGSGGSYGGAGFSAGRNEPYGSFIDPVDAGSGSGTAQGASAGGGRLRITAGSLQVDGVIRANGGGYLDQGSSESGGSGGSVNIVTGTLSGAGFIKADGGTAISPGGGGRVAILATVISVSSGNITAIGGRVLNSSIAAATAGTVFRKLASDTYGLLIIDNNDRTAAEPKTLLWYGNINEPAPQEKCPLQFVITVSGSGAYLLAGDVSTFDFDNDALFGWEESVAGTSPTDSDSNDDGVNDGTALRIGFDPLDMDIDNDGVTNSLELQRGTDLFLVDTDGDGVSDAADAFPLDPSRSAAPPVIPGDTTPPVITITVPSTLVPLN